MKTKVRNTFKIKGSYGTSQKTTIVLRELKHIEKTHSGTLKPEYVVDSAEHKSSPLHEYFEWDDTVASHKWRLQQASSMIISIYDVRNEIGGKEVRHYANVILRDSEERVFVPTTKVMKDSFLRNQFLQQALQDAKLFQAKYSTLGELASVFKAIDRVLVKVG